MIFHSGALGDFIVTWPLALALGRLHPQSRIIYVAQASKGKLAERALRCESADGDAGWHHLFGDPGQLAEPSRKLLENTHTVFSFVAGESDPWSANLKSIRPDVQLVALSPRPPDDDPNGGHVTQWIGEQLARTPAVRTAFDQIMRSVATRGVGYKRSPEGTVCVHPGAGSAKKAWPAKHFVQLVRKLVKERKHVRVLIGESERERLTKEDLEHFAAVAEVSEPKTYVELLDYLGRADAVVCNDTGPGHLAGIIGAPTFSLFGPASSVDRWRPLGPHVHVKKVDDLEHLSADEVGKWVLAGV